MKRKVLFTLATLLLLFTVGAVVAVVYVSNATRELNRLITLHQVENFRRTLLESLQAVQTDLYTLRSDLPRDLDAIVVHVERLKDSAAACRECHHREELVQIFDEVDGLIVEYKQLLSFYITASADTRRIQEMGVRASKVGAQIFEHAEALSLTAGGQLSRMTNQAMARINNVRLILFVTLLGTLVIGIIISLHLIRSVTRPIEVLVEGTRQIASGRLGHEIHWSGKTEFAELADQFNRMSRALRDAYRDLRESNEELSREIRERKQAEQERNRLMDQLIHARKMEAVGTLSGGIAHEFNNLLQVIQGCADLLGRRLGEDESQRRQLDTIVTASQRGADLTRRLLTFSRKMERDMQPLDLNEQLVQLQAMLEKTLPKDIELVVRRHGEPCVVDADAAGLEQVLLNLALNGRDAMPDGGVLTIEVDIVDREECPEGACRDQEAQRWAWIRVSDTGVGMAPHTREHIFDPFFTTKEVGAGTGLGLSVSYGIISAYKGMILCESEPGEGATFSIFLPALAPATEVPVSDPADDPEPPLHAGRGGETLLLVDDEAAILDSIRETLTHLGHRVYTAASGEQALEVYGRHGEEIDVVLLDLGMPGMGGRECLSRLIKRDPGVRVIIATGYGQGLVKSQALAAGAVGFLGKPYRISELLGALKEVS